MFIQGDYISGFDVPYGAARDLSGGGSKDAAADYWANALQDRFARVSDDDLRSELYRTGLEREAIDEMDRHTLIMYALWVLVGNAADEAITNLRNGSPQDDGPCEACGAPHEGQEASDIYDSDDVLRADYVCSECGWPTFSDESRNEDD
jgi:hypothetical protein